MSDLTVLINGVVCGNLQEDRHGALSFEYVPGYAGPPLSLSMPVGLARYDDKTVRPYLMGLLPDEDGIRASIGAAFGISGNNPFRLLQRMGLDCPGAVQVCSDAGSSSQAVAVEALIPLTEHEVAMRLAEIREDAAAAWTGVSMSEGHWSLGGCQAKLALRYDSGRWCECQGAAATTHILKPGVSGLRYQALVEYLSMKTAAAIGLPVAHVAYRLFESEPAIVVERYDRRRGERAGVERIHQEDLCQALGVMPSVKYAEQGGPTTPRVIELLRSTGRNARENVYRFILYLFFNYLVGATDAHAKNHSLLLLAEDDVRLAPLYDVASIAPYRSLAPRQRRPLRAALSIGGENRFGFVGREHVEKMVCDSALEELGLDAELLVGRFGKMAEFVPHALDEVIEEAYEAGTSGIDEVGPAMQAEISANCRRLLSRL